MAQVFRLRCDVPGTWEETLDRFLLWKQAEGISKTTIQDYRFHVGQVFRKYPAVWPDNLSQAALSYLTQDGIAPVTYNIRRGYLKTFFTWCIKEGFISDNPLAGLKKRKAPGRVVNISPDILTQLLSLPKLNTYAGVRDRALFLLTLDSGIRPGEAFSLNVHDVNLPVLEVYIRPEAAKTRTRRTLILSPVTAKAIQDLILARHPAWGSSVPLFCSSEGRPLTRNTWGDRLEMYSKKLGHKIRPYDLRHAFALQFLRNGGNVFALQRIMGHADLSMTRRYLALTQEDLRAEHQRASPVLQLIPERHRVRKIRSPRP